MSRHPRYYLVASSTFFLAPTIYGLFRGHRLLPALSLCTTAASITYWMDSTNAEKRQIDMFIARLTGTAYFLYGFYTVDAISTRMFGYFNLMMILSTYNASTILYQLGNDPFNMTQTWVPFHIAFQAFTTIGKFIVLSG